LVIYRYYITMRRPYIRKNVCVGKCLGLVRTDKATKFHLRTKRHRAGQIFDHVSRLFPHRIDANITFQLVHWVYLTLICCLCLVFVHVSVLEVFP